MHSITCYNCNHSFSSSTLRLGRSETCERCSTDLHACRQCKFFDLKSYNQCREPQAERVVDKEKRNFCDHFEASTLTHSSESTAQDEAKKKLEDLFK